MDQKESAPSNEIKNQSKEEPDKSQPLIQPHEYLTKLLDKYIMKESKSVDALKKIEIIFTEHLDKLKPDHILDSLYLIVNAYVQGKFRKKIEAREMIYEIFGLVAASQILLFSPKFSQLYAILSIVGDLAVSFYTDDSYKFNKQIKNLTKVIEELNPQQNPEEEEKATTPVQQTEEN